MTLGDVNGDGHIDIVTAGYYGGGCVLLGRGDGTFADPMLCAAVFSDFALGDIDGDGRTDIVTPHGHGYGANGVDVLVSRGDGTFANPIPYPLASPSPIALHDVNDDGRLDIVAARVRHSIRAPWPRCRGRDTGCPAPPARIRT
jgi:hypothetical protein